MWNDDHLGMASKRPQTQINKQSKIHTTTGETYIHESPVSSSEKRASKIFGERRRISSIKTEIETHPDEIYRSNFSRLQAKQPKTRFIYEEQISESSEIKHSTSPSVESDEYDTETFVEETRKNITQNSHEKGYLIKYECSKCHECFTTDYSKRKHRNTKHLLFLGKKLFLKKLMPKNDASVSTSRRSTNDDCPYTAPPCRTSTENSNSEQEDCDDQRLDLPNDKNIKKVSGDVVKHRAITDLTGVPYDEKVQGKKVLPMTIIKMPVHQLENSKQNETSQKRKSNNCNAAIPAKVQRRRTTFQERQYVTNFKIKRRRSMITTSVPESVEQSIKKKFNEEDLNAAVKYTLFKCRICFNHFVSIDTFSEHLKICTKDMPAKECKGCGFNFMECELEKHAQNRPPCNSIGQFEIMKIEVQNVVNRKKYKEKKVTLFRCGICKIHFTKCFNFKLHLLNGEHLLENSRECHKCGFSFIEDFEHHYEEHHNQLKLSREDFSVQNNDEIWVDSDEVQIKNHENGDKEISNGDKKANKKSQEYGDRVKGTGKNNYNKNITQIINSVRDVQDATINKREKPKLYQCIQCSVHFLTVIALKKHISTDSHIAIVTVQCNECDLWFCSNNMLNKHKKLHHSQIYLNSPTDFDISCYSNNNVQNQLVCAPLLRKQINNDTSEENSDFDSEITIYKCKYCGVHYTLEKSIMSHIKNHELKKDYCVNTKICEKCGLKFTIASLVDHNQEVHYKGSDVTPANFVFIEYPLNNSVAVTHNDKQLENENRTAEYNFMGEYDNNATIVLKEDRKGVNVNSDKDKCGFELYKCSSCNVHFTEMSACEEHSKKHKDSHNFKYKKCGCGLRFDKAEFIKHRIKHHARNFDLNDVVIIEFQSTAMNDTEKKRHIS